MTVPTRAVEGDLARQLMFVSTPALWPAWPFLPVVRRTRGVEELGVMFDAVTTCGVMGYSACVFVTNLFTLPTTLEGMLALPREVYDTGEDVIQAGWCVD